MEDLEQTLRTACYGKDLECRKGWYSPAAIAYQQVRPRYPQALLDWVIRQAQLTATSDLLEIGCGPAIATLPFAQLGCRIVGLEPNPDFYQLAQQACQAFPNVQLQQCAFEEWELRPQAFNAVLAASSFHWIDPVMGCAKAATALRPGGCLILLWNKELQPTFELYQQLLPLYQTHAPSLDRPYEDEAAQRAILAQLGQRAISSGQFRQIHSEAVMTEVTYTIDQYLLLLETYSPYLKLPPLQKQALFTGLRAAIAATGNTIQLSYLSACHIATP